MKAASPQVTENAVRVVGELDRVLRQGADDLHEQAAGHQDGARLRHLGADPDPRRHLVVEAGESEEAAPGSTGLVFLARAEQQAR